MNFYIERALEMYDLVEQAHHKLGWVSDEELYREVCSLAKEPVDKEFILDYYRTMHETLELFA